ncbi:hypothetical protein [Bradyrhizobium lablabi]|uniref:hypothetical protein n=1 Tax=Bradyrhizobium lablabi TaxID=722472 RepID=UPI001BAB7C67|nr:hypothetical protein [Bradyrhizobium lablabi]
MRREALHHFSIFRIFEILVFLSAEAPVPSVFRPEMGFSRKPLGLRRCLLEILRRRDGLTAHDLAGIAYGRRIIVRPGYRRHVTNSQMVCVQRALRRMIDKGLIEVLYRYRRRKVYVLRREVEQ